MAKIKEIRLPLVAIVGRTNVGKSTLFNRLIEERKAIISRIPGTTRDRNYGECRWRGKSFALVDTGGIMEDTTGNFQKEIQAQAEAAISQADLLIFMVDITDGVLREDKKVAKMLRNSDKPVILALNKADSPKARALSVDSEFIRLGLGKPWPVSAKSGSGTGDLLDEVFAKLPEKKETKQEELPPPVNIALIGRPNVGKSSFVNAVLGEERVIVSNVPHTTREPQDTPIIYNERPFVLIDTAGIRKKSNIKSLLEKKSVSRSLKAMERADVVLFLVEADQPIGKQDKHLAGYIKDCDKGLIIVVNKWDLVPEKDVRTTKEYTAYFQRQFPFLKWAPMIFTSAKTGQRVEKALEMASKIKEERAKELDPQELYRFMMKLVKAHKPPRRILGIVQAGTEPPQFKISITRKKAPFPAYYLDIVEKALREKYGFEGTPVKVSFREHEIRIKG